MTGAGRSGAGRSGLAMVRLLPGRWTRVPDTGCEIRWDGTDEVLVFRVGGFWDLSPLCRPGRLLAWERLTDRPHLGVWPLLPPVTRTTYRSAAMT